MANVAHSALTGSNLHEPKGVATAASGSVYIANGSGSGSWTISEAVVTGMIADFATPLAPTGWLECDGSDVSTTTYNALYTAMTIQQTGSRGVGSAIITGLTSTTNMKAGYYVFGTGITSGTTISTVDSATQITLSATASSSGSSTLAISPWLLASGTIRVPDTKTSGRYRRSRTTAVQLGTTQADAFGAHIHAGTSDAGGSHAHSGTTDSADVNHTHTVSAIGSSSAGTSLSFMQGNSSGVSSLSTVGISATAHTHSFTTDSAASHTHNFNTNSTGSAETRPISLVVITCVKT